MATTRCINLTFKGAKLGIGFICAACFALNSLIIFEDMIEGKTGMSSNLENPEGNQLMSPTLLICSSSSFKEATLNTNLEDYKRNSLRLDDFLVDASWIVANEHGTSIMQDIVEIHTAFHGSCYAINPNLPVIC